MKKTVILLFFLLIITIAAAADPAFPVQITNISEKNTYLGDLFYFNLKDDFAKSKIFDLTDSNTNRLILLVKTAQPFSDYQDRINYSVIWLMEINGNKFYIDNILGGTTATVSSIHTTNILLRTDKILTALKEELLNYSTK